MNTNEDTTTPAGAPDAQPDPEGPHEAPSRTTEPSDDAQAKGADAPAATQTAEAAPAPEAPAQASAPETTGERSEEPREADAEPAPPDAPTASAAPEAAAAAAAAPSVAQASDDDDEDWEEQPGDDIGNRLPGTSLPHPRPAMPAWRVLPKPAAAQPAAAAPHAAAAADASGEASTAKKRRRRRRRKGASGQDATGGEGAVAEGAAAEGADAEGEHAEAGAAAEGVAEGEDDGAGEGNDAEAGDGAEGPAADGAAHAGGEKRKRRKGQHAQPARERPAFSIGEEVFGKVSNVTEHAIWIDIAGKATGLFDRREILDEEPPVEGDQFIATVASTGVRGGMLLLSRTAVQLDQAIARAEEASKSGEPIDGFVTGAVKGGLEVDVGGLRAFAPASHVDLRHGADLSYLVGQRLDFIVTQFAKRGRDIVVSRRKMLEEENRKLRAEAISAIEAGSVHKAVVRKIVAWGVFVALPEVGGVEGLIHMTEASHDRGARLNDLFKPGAEMEVKVLRVDEKGKLWLSRKAVTADPWDAVKEKYTPGSRHKGKVARLQPFGAFIELEPGVDGLIHTADLSMKPIQHPSDVVKVGDEIEVVVANCDSAGHRIGLHPAPPEGEEAEPRQRVQQGKAVKVAVSQVTEGGLVVRVLGVTGRSARGFIPAGHTGTQRGTDLRKEFPIGTQFEAKIIEVDSRRGEAKLSIRALKDDAEKQAYQQYRAGVAREAKFGTFADLMKKS